MVVSEPNFDFPVRSDHFFFSIDRLTLSTFQIILRLQSERVYIPTFLLPFVPSAYLHLPLEIQLPAKEDKKKLTVRVELNMKIPRHLDRSILLGTRSRSLNNNNNVALLVVLGCDEFRVEGSFGVDDFEESGVGGLVCLLDSLCVCDRVLLCVCYWHVLLLLFVGWLCGAVVGWC